MSEPMSRDIKDIHYRLVGLLVLGFFMYLTLRKLSVRVDMLFAKHVELSKKVATRIGPADGTLEPQLETVTN